VKQRILALLALMALGLGVVVHAGPPPHAGGPSHGHGSGPLMVAEHHYEHHYREHNDRDRRDYRDHRDYSHRDHCWDDHRRHRQVRDDQRFSHRDRQLIRDWYKRNLPPGLAKQGKIPPGHAKRPTKGEPLAARGGLRGVAA